MPGVWKSDSERSHTLSFVEGQASRYRWDRSRAPLPSAHNFIFYSDTECFCDCPWIYIPFSRALSTALPIGPASFDSRSGQHPSRSSSAVHVTSAISDCSSCRCRSAQELARQHCPDRWCTTCARIVADRRSSPRITALQQPAPETLEACRPAAPWQRWRSLTTEWTMRPSSSECNAQAMQRSVWPPGRVGGQVTTQGCFPAASSASPSVSCSLFRCSCTGQCPLISKEPAHCLMVVHQPRFSALSEAHCVSLALLCQPPAA